MTSNSAACALTISTVDANQLPESPSMPAGRSAVSTVGMSRHGTSESPLAKTVTSWPRRTSSVVSSWTMRSVPPYADGGTRSTGGATWAMRNGRGALRTVARMDGPMATWPSCADERTSVRPNPRRLPSVLRFASHRISGIATPFIARGACAVMHT